jgi:glucose uptake protein
MILPGSQLYNLLLLAFGMLCLGSWAATYRMTSKWRFELYYLDFALGVFIAAVIVGLTFGSLGWDGFALSDDFRIAGKQKEALAMLGGALFNLGNMLILACVSLSGLTVACLIGLGMMMTSGLVITYFTSPSGNLMMLLAGAGLVVISAAILAIAYRTHALDRLMLLAQQGKTKSTKRTASLKGALLAACGGVVGSIYFPLLAASAEGENGVGPYAQGILFAVGIGVSTVVYGLFFMNLPVQGDPVEIADYFKGKVKFHWLGIGGGILFYIGLASTLILTRAEGRNIVPAYEIRALMLAAALVGTSWGLLRWKEFAGAGGTVRNLLIIALLVFVTGVASLSAAAGFSAG